MFSCRWSDRDSGPRALQQGSETDRAAFCSDMYHSALAVSHRHSLRELWYEYQNRLTWLLWCTVFFIFFFARSLKSLSEMCGSVGIHAFFSVQKKDEHSDEDVFCFFHHFLCVKVPTILKSFNSMFASFCLLMSRQIL